MKHMWTALFLGMTAAAGPATAQQMSTMTAAHSGSPRAVRVEPTVKATVAEVWRVLTTSEGRA